MIGKFCYICGKTKNITFHHFRLRDEEALSEKRTNKEREELGIILKYGQEGMPVCRSCHDRIEESKLFISKANSLKKAFNRGYSEALIDLDLERKKGNFKHFQENRKIRIHSSKKSLMKHEVIKTIGVMVILNKHNSKKVYTEYPIGKRIADVYFEIGNEKYCVEIQKNLNEKYRKDTEEFYLDNDITPIIIPVKKMPDDINELWEQIENLL